MFLTVSVGAVDFVKIMYNSANFIWMLPLLLTLMSLGNAASDAAEEV
jgi:hypothetical protein